MHVHKIGDQFPTYCATAVRGGDLSDVDPQMPWDHFATVSSADHAGMWRTVLFWSKDALEVSRRDIAAFASCVADFEARNVQILGSSVDSKYTHFYWRANHVELNAVGFPILSDFSRTLASAAGVLNIDGVADRAIFIVDPTNKIRYMSVTSDSAPRSVVDILQVLDSLQSATPGRTRFPNSSPRDSRANSFECRELVS